MGGNISLVLQVAEEKKTLSLFSSQGLPIPSKKGKYKPIRNNELFSSMLYYLYRQTQLSFLWIYLEVN